MLAVAGAHETDWAVRIYDLSTGQPEALASWTGGLDLNHSIVTSLAWNNNSNNLIAGVEHVGGEKANAVTMLLLKPNDQNQEVSTSSLDNWTMISEIQSDRLSTDFVWLLGKKSGKAIVQRFDIENMELKPGITTAEEVITPKSLIVDENEIWIAGENANGNALVEAVGMDIFSIPHDSHISAMVKTGSNAILQNSKHLMGHWKFDGNANDSSANQNHGKMVGGRFMADRKGNPNSALFLDGKDDHVVIKHSDSLNPVDQLSISMWLKFENLKTKWTPVLEKGGYVRGIGKHREYAVVIKNDTSMQLWSAGNNKNQLPHKTAALSKAEWIHFGASLDRRNHIAKIFINGRHVLLANDRYSNFNNNKNDLIIGSIPSIEKFGGFSNFNGFIDDLRLYSVALEHWQFEKSMNPQSFAQKKLRTDEKLKHLMGRWDFDGNVNDSSTNQNHGKMVGGEFVADRTGKIQPIID